MKHPERAITLWTPFANADGKTSGVEQVQDLLRADDVRVIAQVERAFPLAELTAIPDGDNAHPDFAHVLSRIGFSVDLNHVPIDMESAPRFDFRDIRNVRTRVHRRCFESNSRETKPTFWVLIERFLVIALGVFRAL